MKITKFLKYIAAAAPAAVLATVAAASTFDGSTIRATAHFPVIPGSAQGGPVDALVGAGVEFSDGQFGAFFGPSFDFAGSTITITHAATGHQSGTFNGYVFNDLNNVLGDFTGLSVISDSSGFFSSDLSRLSYDAENLFVNFESLSFSNPNEVIVLGVTFGGTTAVPLPAGGVLLLSALGVAALARRRKSA